MLEILQMSSQILSVRELRLIQDVDHLFTMNAILNVPFKMLKFDFFFSFSSFSLFFFCICVVLLSMNLKSQYGKFTCIPKQLLHISYSVFYSIFVWGNCNEYEARARLFNSFQFIFNKTMTSIMCHQQHTSASSAQEFAR